MATESTYDTVKRLESQVASLSSKLDYLIIKGKFHSANMAADFGRTWTEHVNEIYQLTYDFSFAR